MIEKPFPRTSAGRFGAPSPVVIDLAARRPSRPAPAAQPGTAWYHDAAVRDDEGKPRPTTRLR